MRRWVLLLVALFMFICMVVLVVAEDNPKSELAAYLFKPQELGPGWELVAEGSPEEPLIGITAIFEKTDNSTLAQSILKFDDVKEASSFYNQKLEEAGENALPDEDLADQAYIKPARQGKPRELVFRVNNMVTIYSWNRAEGTQDLDLIGLARSQLNKMGQDVKSS